MKKTRETRARAAKVAGRIIACGLFALVAQGGCADSLPIEFAMEPDGGTSATGGLGNPGTGGDQGSGGSSATGGSTSTGGSFGTGGVNGTGGTTSTGGSFGTGGSKATGGSTGTGGFGPGGTTGTGGRATGGSTGTGGFPATGGTTGTGGMKATGGTTGTGGAGGAAAATFTQVYQMVISANCTGSQCHSPGSNGGFSFSSQSTAYSSIKSKVSAGNANSSQFYTVVNSGQMPPGKKLSSSLISLIASWINAGALNN